MSNIACNHPALETYLAGKSPAQPPEPDEPLIAVVDEGDEVEAAGLVLEAPAEPLVTLEPLAPAEALPGARFVS